MGRPSKFTQALADEICRELADGNSLRSICDDNEAMPHRDTVRVWLRDKPEFSAQYARARDEQADGYADRAVHEALTAEDAAIGRLRMDALKWAAGKLAPKRYGDKLQHTGADGEGPVQIAEVKRIIVDANPRNTDA